MKNHFLAILSAFIILMAVFGTGLVAAEESTDDVSVDDSSSSGNSADDSSTDSVSDSSSDDSSSDISTDDSSDNSEDDSTSDDSVSGSDNSASDSADEPSSDDINTDDSASDETTNEDVSESGDMAVEDNSNNADDGSTVIETNIEETNIKETNADIILDETNAEDVTVTDIDTTIISDNDMNYSSNDIEISGYDNRVLVGNSTSDNDYNYTYSDNDNITIDYTGNSIINITNVETKNVNIDNSRNTNISFTDNSVVNNINFVSKESGKTKVIVEETTEKPPVENVYKSFNIFIDNAEVTNNVENAAVDFKVEKSWLIENNLDSSTIILNMYEGGKWIEVPVTVTGEDSQFVYFKAKVSKYSTFAISSKAITVDKVLKQENMTVSEEEIDGPTKSVVIKMLEFVIELLEGK